MKNFKWIVFGSIFSFSVASTCFADIPGELSLADAQVQMANVTATLQQNTAARLAQHQNILTTLSDKIEQLKQSLASCTLPACTDQIVQQMDALEKQIKDENSSYPAAQNSIQFNSVNQMKQVVTSAMMFKKLNDLQTEGAVLYPSALASFDIYGLQKTITYSYAGKVYKVDFTLGMSFSSVSDYSKIQAAVSSPAALNQLSANDGGILQFLTGASGTPSSVLCAGDTFTSTDTVGEKIKARQVY
jgi:hypothetical protein